MADKKIEDRAGDSLHNIGGPDRTELLKAYYAWVRIPSDRYKDRVIAWENYVAIRDGVENKNQSKVKLSAIDMECLAGDAPVRRYTH